MEKPKRSANWQQDEKDLLSKLALDKLEIIEDARIDTNTNKKKKEAWSSIHQLFNQVSAHSRTLDQIQNQWRKTKSFAKTNNSAFIRQTKQTGGGPAPKPLSSVEEELVSRLPKHFEIDFNVYDSNSQVNETSTQEIDLSIQDVLIKTNDKMCDTEGDTPIKEKKLPLTFKRKRRSMNCENDFESENSKRIKLLDLSIKQKELEIKYSEENHIVETRRNALIEKQMKEEHALKVEKLKLEI